MLNINPFVAFLFGFVITWLQATSSKSISSTAPQDVVFGISISLTFTYESDDPQYDISATDALKIKNILHDIISDQIATIFDINTTANCIQHSIDLLTLQTTSSESILNSVIIACTQELEDRLLLLYSANNTLVDEFVDGIESETSSLIITGEVLMDIDTINASDIHNILSTDNINDINEKEINKIWFINTVYIGTAFVASCIVFVILFMYCIHKKRASKETKQSEDNLQKDMELGATAPGLSRMQSLSSSPGSPRQPTTPNELGANYKGSERYLVYGTEDIRALTPSPYPMSQVTGANDVDFVQHSSKIKHILKPLPKNQPVEIVEDPAVNIPSIKFSDLNLDLDDDDAADPELSYSPNP